MPVQCNIRAVESATHSRLTHPSLQHGADSGLLARKFVATVPTAERSAQLLAFSLSAGQPFLGALANKVALYLGRQAESEGKYLAVDVVSQLVAFFHGQYPRFLCHALVKDGHNLHEIPAQAANLGQDERVTLLHFLQ